jgi:hypothetical protein
MGNHGQRACALVDADGDGYEHLTPFTRSKCDALRRTSIVFAPASHHFPPLLYDRTRDHACPYMQSELCSLPRSPNGPQNPSGFTQLHRISTPRANAQTREGTDV